MVKDILFEAKNVEGCGFEFGAMEVEMKRLQDLGVMVLDHPPELFQLPFAVGQGLGFAGGESSEDCCVRVFEVGLACESGHFGKGVSKTCGGVEMEEWLPR